jgi:ankyrin repeat protein
VKRLAEVLLAAGANINAQSKDGNTPAHLAKNSPLKGDDVHTFLKKSGADSTLKNNLGQTA